MQRNRYILRTWPVVMLTVIFMAPFAFGAVTNVWEGTLSADWFEDGNWSLGSVPGEDEHAAIDSSGTHTPLLTNATAMLDSLVMTGGTLTFSNWTARLRGKSIDIRGGTLTLPGSFDEGAISNRIWVTCDTFTLAQGAILDAKGMGYAPNGQGPGGATGRAGASHGGFGDPSSVGTVDYIGRSQIYGDKTAPQTPGSSNSESGGGVVRIDAAVSVTLDGTIDASANKGIGNDGGPAGGSIYITTGTIHGDGGLLTVRGGDAGRNDRGSGGGGGRIALAYDSGAQAALSQPIANIVFRAAHGQVDDDRGNHRPNIAEAGTLWLPDPLFLTPDIGAMWDDVRLYIPGFTEWNVPYLDISGKIRFQELETLRVSGDVTLRNDGILHLFGGDTNETESVEVGMRFELDGDLMLRDESRLFLSSDRATGGSPIVFCRHLTVEPDALITVRALGFAPGYGPGGGAIGQAGGAHGGTGGLHPNQPETERAQPYGASQAPLEPGSGGGGELQGGPGGGAVRVLARGTIRVDGAIDADGGRSSDQDRSGGAGGAILLTAERFEGEGTLRAVGADPSRSDRQGSQGAGGRIAVWTPKMPLSFLRTMAAGHFPDGAGIPLDMQHPETFAGEIAVTQWDGFTGSVNVAPAKGAERGAEGGTLLFGALRFGTLFLMR